MQGSYCTTFSIPLGASCSRCGERRILPYSCHALWSNYIIKQPNPISPSEYKPLQKGAFQKYKPWGLFSEFYGNSKTPCIQQISSDV